MHKMTTEGVIQHCAECKAEGRREMALELAEWHEEQAASFPKSWPGSLVASTHERSAVECRRRAGE